MSSIPSLRPAAATTRRRSALLHSASLGALVVASASAPPCAQAAPFRSLSQALALSGKAAAQAATSPAVGVTASQQASLGAQNLSTAASRFRSLADALASPPASAGASPIVVDGYGPGTGLQAAPGALAGGPTWKGAALPTTAATPGGVTVTVTQNQALAQLTWKTFNVGAHTKLAFDQSAGGSLARSWTVINTVLDPDVSGSQVLGSITAPGKVYVLNRNGIAFSAGSTVNVGSLIAATADIAASQFTSTASGVTTFNLYGAQTVVGSNGRPTDPVTGFNLNYQPTFQNGSNASITVAPGAAIQTPAPTGSNGGGYVMLLGGNVANSGVITTPLGQTVLAAGTQFFLRQGTTGSTTQGNTLSTTLGSEVSTTNYPIGNVTGAPAPSAVNAVFLSGSVANAGIVVADQGDITLAGHAITQSGALLSTTTVDTRGTIHLLTPNDGSDPTSSITLAPGSVTEILPEDNGLTALDSQRASNIANSAVLNAQRLTQAQADAASGNVTGTLSLNNTSLLADQLGESRVELSSGGGIDVGAGALVLAQGGQIAVAGGSRVLLENGANLDVSGTNRAHLASSALDLSLYPTGTGTSDSATLSASVNDLFANIQPFQLRDSAANRDGALKGSNVYVDEQTLVEVASGAFAGNIYTPGGLLEVSGYLGLVPHGILEWTAVGGQVTLQATQFAVEVTGQMGSPNPVSLGTQAGSIVTQPQAVINLQGGTVAYDAGPVQQTYVQASDGQVYNINQAPADLVYTGIYGGQVTAYPRWRVTDYYVSPLLTPPTIEEPGYTVGRDAGSITIAAGTAQVQGPIYAGVTVGQYQLGQRPAGVTDPYLLAQSVVPQAGTLRFGNYLDSTLQTLTLPTQVVFASALSAGALPASAAGTLAAGTLAAGTLAAPLANTAVFDSEVLDADGFATLSVGTGGSVTVNAPIAVADGGSVSLTGSGIVVAAGLTARSGSITLSDQLASTGAPVGLQLAPPLRRINVETGLPVGSGTAGGSGSGSASGTATVIPVNTVPSVTLAAGAVLDARGVWTNALIDPASRASLAYANGGSITIQNSGGVALQAGGRVDVSSGGGFAQDGSVVSGRGGSVSITADVDSQQNHPNVALLVADATFAGYGSAGGGTLSLTGPAFKFGTGGQVYFSSTTLDTAVLSSGFSDYVINGFGGVDVLPGQQLTAAEPIYVLNQGASLPTGSDPSAAYSVMLPPLYTPTRSADVLAERAGASISLLSVLGAGYPGAPDSVTLPNADGGAVTIGAGAGVSVDPGRSITLAGFETVGVFGTLTAHGGSIGVFNTHVQGAGGSTTAPIPSQPSPAYLPGTSVWLAAGSLLDVSGQAVVQTDPAGRRFGLATSGGTIAVGSTSPSLATLAQVIVRPGAVLDADGAQALVDVIPNTEQPSLLPQSRPVTLAGNGGSISLDSIDGVALDGTATARAGAPGAAGGTLSVSLDAALVSQFSNYPTYLYVPQQVLITQGTVQVQPGSLQVGQVSPADTFGLARISQAQIESGGFASVDVGAQTGAVVFEGDVALHAPGAIVLSTGVIGASSPIANESIAAPYVELAGQTSASAALVAASPPTTESFGTLTIQADLIDQSNLLYLGGLFTGFAKTAATASSGGSVAGVGFPSQAVVLQPFGFRQTNIDSTGDVRFLGSAVTSGSNLAIESVGNIAFDAAQIYPASAAAAQVVAGYNLRTMSGVQPITLDGTITVHGTGAAVAAPYSVGGTLSFVADTIEQAGVVRAPEGTLAFSDGAAATSVVFPSQVTFAPGSVTSVSLYGQTVPYGGTVDGVTYQVPGGGAPGPLNPAVEVTAQSIDVEQGATIDLRGGGTLTGAGFIFGRGGTADVLTTPLLNLAGGTPLANAAAQVSAVQPSGGADPVYAILPGYGSGYAPPARAGDAAYSATSIGEQITVGGEVPGLAAGTYTLLPAYYALLPGGYRVELTAGTLPAGSNLPRGNFTTIDPVTLGTAGTSVSSPVATAALFTSGTNIRQLSQYDEESFDSFEAQAATQFGAPRPFLPEDAKTLILTYPGVIAYPESRNLQAALSFAPSALLDAPAPPGPVTGAAGGYGATLEVSTTANIAVAGPTDPVYGNEVVLQAGVLSALDLPRLVLGGTLAIDANASNTIDVLPTAASVNILPHAVLTAGDVLLTTSVNQVDANALPITGEILVLPGGTISTIGAGPAAYDTATSGYFFNNDQGSGIASPVIDVSNGHVVFVPATDSANGAVVSVGDGSGLLAGGSLNVAAPSQTTVTIGNANLGARYAAISVADINIGSATALHDYASLLPQGLSITPQALSGLLNGSKALGTPASSVLTLTATQEVNVLGSVALDTGAADLVLNTPAIYGVGSAGATATINAAAFTWSGVSTSATTQLSSGQPVLSSALPGGQTGLGLAGLSDQLAITAGTITLGYGPQSQPDDQLVLSRVVSGFATVTLTGTSEITANNQSALAVYVSQPVFGQPGIGGDLHLVSPLVTTAPAAVLQLSAGGAVTLAAPPPTAAQTSPAAQVSPAATASVASLGGEIDVTGASVQVATAVALPSGQFNVTAQNNLDLAAGGSIDLSGRAVHLFDQTVYTPGGRVMLESTAGSITLDTGSAVNVSSPGTYAGSIVLNALAGGVAVDGALQGAAPASQSGGSFTVIAGTLSTTTQAPNLAAGGSAFANINAALDAGGFDASRSFELGTDVGPSGAVTTNIVIGNDAADAPLVIAHGVNVSADFGSIDVAGTIDASGTAPGTIVLSAQQNLTLAATGVLDAHATQTAVDSTGAPIGAENRAQVTLSSAAGSLLLAGGTVDLTYPDNGAVPGGAQGQLVLNAPRAGVGAAAITGGDVAVTAAALNDIEGAQSIALYAWTTYLTQSSEGVVAAQYAGHPHGTGAVVSLGAIDLQSQAFIKAAGANAALTARLAGLAAYGAAFHLRPGVEVDSSQASNGTITISGDVDLSGYRYSDVGYGLQQVAGVTGSGEPGAILFRAAGDLVVNGSISDGFAPPPDSKAADHLPGDAGWVILAPIGSGLADPLSADILLPASLTVTTQHGTSVTHDIELAAGTTFSEARAVSLNYGIHIDSANISADTVIPFAAKLAVAPGSTGITIPAGGFVTTAAITAPDGTVTLAGTFLPGGTLIAPGSRFAAGSLFPVAVQVASGTFVPQGTLLDIFDDSTLTLVSNTAPLPVGAFLPSNTAPQFVTEGGLAVQRLELRPVTTDADGERVQGLIYPLAQLLPAGAQSWNIALVSGANLASADTQAVQPRSVLASSAPGTAINPASQANTAYQEPGSLILDDQHELVATSNTAYANPAFSVIRTGTGALSLVAGGNFDQSSLYGIYTAGTQDPLPGGAAANAAYDSARDGVNNSRFVTPGGKASTVNRIIDATYQANYPNDGGDVLVAAQGSVTGDLIANVSTAATGLVSSDAVGNWLWRQGSTQFGQPTAWWINFGTFVDAYLPGDIGSAQTTPTVQLVGFQGIGALGGGNVTVSAGTDAGQTTNRSGADFGASALRGEGLIVAVGSTGRLVSANGTTTEVQTGGGNLTLHVGGKLNSLDTLANAAILPGANNDLDGVLVDLRGNITLTAGAVGRLDETYSSTINPGSTDPRPANPFAPVYTASEGVTLLPGDGIVSVDTDRDLVVDAVGDPGRVTQQNLTRIATPGDVNAAYIGVNTAFSLWTPDTAVSLTAFGGNVTPVSVPTSEPAASYYNAVPTDDRYVYPSQLSVTAATGDIVYGNPAGHVDRNANALVYTLETAPSANEQVAFLAGASIVANSFAIDLSGADPALLSSPLNPAVTGTGAQFFLLPEDTNVRVGGGTTQSALALFALEPDTPTTPYLSAPAASTAALFYAASGDILNFTTGETLTFAAAADETLPQWYLAAKPVRILAAGDIVDSGTRPSQPAGTLQQNQQSDISGVYTTSGNLFLNTGAQSVSVVSAGQDILSGYFYVGGPGLLEVDAGRNIQQIGFTGPGGQSLLQFGSIKSLGSLLSGAPISLTGGAGIVVNAGIGTGAAYTAFAELYLDPANQANLALPITAASNDGKVQETYTAQLLAWLQQNYPYTGSEAGALAYFLDPADVPVVNQDAFLRSVFYGELLASGQQYNDSTSRFFHDYVRGRQAIDTLLPGASGGTTNLGEPAGYTGAITMASGPLATGPADTAGNPTSQLYDAGVATEHGGDIEVLAPGGQVVLGTNGSTNPGGGTGLITNGSGNIDVFADGSVLLGKSRIFTNAGGNIQIWSATGDINAGIGARTTVVFNPPIISYDQVGDIVETPAVPTSGAGIATEQPLPSIPAGNIDLTAPVGTIDAGEAGVRSSGNLNLAAARLANTSGFSAGGKTTGNAAPPSVSLASVEAAGATAGASQAAAQNLNGSHTENQLPTIVEVEVLSIGGETDEERRRKRKH